MSLQVLKTPLRAPQANAYCERFIGTARRECLDWMIPLNERHLRRLFAEWIPHYNRERPHSALGPGLPTGQQLVRWQPCINYHRRIALWLTRFSVACIITTTWSLSRPEFLRSTGIEVPFVNRFACRSALMAGRT